MARVPKWNVQIFTSMYKTDVWPSKATHRATQHSSPYSFSSWNATQTAQHVAMSDTKRYTLHTRCSLQHHNRLLRPICFPFTQNSAQKAADHY